VRRCDLESCDWSCLVGDSEQWNGGVGGGDEPVEDAGVSVAAGQQYGRVTVRRTQVHAGTGTQQHVGDVRVSIQRRRVQRRATTLLVTVTVTSLYYAPLH